MGFFGFGGVFLGERKFMLEFGWNTGIRYQKGGFYKGDQIMWVLN